MDFFIVNTTVKISTMGYWILYYIRDSVLQFSDSSGQPLDINIYGLDIESYLQPSLVILFNII